MDSSGNNASTQEGVNYTFRTRKENTRVRVLIYLVIFMMASLALAKFAPTEFSIRMVLMIVLYTAIVCVIPIAILFEMRRTWNSIQLFEDKFILHSEKRSLEFQRHMLKVVRTHRASKSKQEVGVVKITSPIKNQTLKFKLQREGAKEVFAWFQELEVEQTGNPDPDALEGPEEEITHVGFIKLYVIWREVRAWGLLALFVPFVLFSLYIFVKNPSWDEIEWLFGPVLSTVAGIGIVLHNRKTLSRNPVMKVQLSSSRMRLTKRKGEIIDVPIDRINAIRKEGKQSFGIEDVHTYHIYADNGAWRIYVRPGMSGAKELTQWLEAGRGRHK